jgi:hypothetical protein
MKVPCGTINECPEDATIVALDDPDARDFWAVWFQASAKEIETALRAVGPDLAHIEDYFRGRTE